MLCGLTTPSRATREACGRDQPLQPTGPSAIKGSVAHACGQGNQPSPRNQKDILCEAEIRQLAGGPQHNQGFHSEEPALYFAVRQCRKAPK